MKVVVDLFPCQTASRFRGIGRYTHSLVREMARNRASHEFIALANAGYAESFEDLRREFTKLLPPGSFLPYRYIEIDPNKGEKDPFFEVATSLVHHTYEMLSPDFVLYPSFFEGWGEKGVVPLPANGFPSALRGVIVYDFIPYIYAERFLDLDTYFKSFYLRRLELLKRFDLLLAISESTRQDAIKILGLPSERVVNISAATSATFRHLNNIEKEKEALLARFGITKPFIFYTGNVEFHKNMEKTLEAFACLPLEVRQKHQFVLTHTGDKTAFLNRIRSYGLEDHEVVITGHISDRELVILYNSCVLFIFPSLYEGFGLPILEAMACGAPVIASNSSSIPEVMGREDAMFNPSSVESITASLYKALTDGAFRQDLSSYGLERVKQFSWEKSAQKAWSALEDALERNKRARQVHIHIPANSRKLRVAYVSPLPPEKSGIADYSAELLPHLVNYVDIDLFIDPGVKVKGTYNNKKFAVYPWMKLIKRQDQYNTVIYQIGNSKFHRHMFHLLREVPGIVVLHDFFLSHIREYVHSSRYLNSSYGNFYTEAGDAHGLFSMVDFVQRGLNEAIWDWPLNWSVLKYARKIIVHSDYQNTLLHTFYGHGWYPRPAVIKQPHKIEAVISAKDRQLTREKLGINPDHFTFSSFGFLNSNKLILIIIEAFSKYLEVDPQSMLIFVGETENEDFTQRIQDLIQQLGITEHVRITGYVSHETFHDYLNASEAAIQLRTNSRGETSRAMLDCMALGIPTIINAHGSLNDYHEDDVVKLSEHPTVEELAQAMTRLRQDDTFREKIRQNALNAIITDHNPEQVSAAYYDVLLKDSQTHDRALFAPLLNAITNHRSDTDDVVLRSVARFASANLALRSQPRILIDVTNTAYMDLRTGIQRVVKNLIRGLYSLNDPSNHVELVRLKEGKLYRAARFAERLFTLPEESLGSECPVYIQPGDTLFMLDTSWNLYDQFLPVFAQVRQAGGRIYALLHDLIPVKNPEYCTSSTVEAFQVWIKKAVQESDEIICVSKSVMNEVDGYIHEHLAHLPHKCDLSYIHLGADIPVVLEESKVRESVSSIVESTSIPLFLMVGTIEPRKGHAFALDAFEQLWIQGIDYRLCITGKIGWNVEALEQRIRSHPELGRRLFFIENATDAEINLCYAAATALVIPSVTEGFGLPIIEAALHHVPALASDIAIFREVAGEGGTYFSLQSPTNLVKAVEEMAHKTREERVVLADKVKYLTWKESAAWTLDILYRRR